MVTGLKSIGSTSGVATVDGKALLLLGVLAGVIPGDGFTDLSPSWFSIGINRTGVACCVLAQVVQGGPTITVAGASVVAGGFGNGTAGAAVAVEAAAIVDAGGPSTTGVGLGNVTPGSF